MAREIGLDVRGRACPIPVLELARAMRSAEEGDVVRLHADDPAAARDITAWCEATGNKLLALTRDGPVLNARVQKA